MIAQEITRTNRVADVLEAEAGRLGDTPDAPGIALLCLLGYAERRHRTWPWRDGRPGLAAWYDAMAARPSFAATLPPLSGL
ncbi:glutathione S-transferase C-terminal domain-containing protein [Siccirubricoccus deserti]